MRLRDVLQQRGFAAQNLAVLADGVDGARPPTRANIIAALDELVRTVQTRDTKRGLEDDDVQAFIDAGVATHVTRGQPGRTPSSRTGIQVFTLEIKQTATGRR